MDTYGWIQHLNGDSAAGLPYLEGAAEALASDPIVQLHLGVVQAAAGEADAAKTQLQKGLDMLPEGQKGRSVALAREALARLNAPAAETAGTGTAGTGMAGTGTAGTGGTAAPAPGQATN